MVLAMDFIIHTLQERAKQILSVTSMFEMFTDSENQQICYTTSQLGFDVVMFKIL
jgi:hypothetical protein